MADGFIDLFALLQGGASSPPWVSMSGYKTVNVGGIQGSVYLALPDAATMSDDVYHVVLGSEIDARLAKSLAYTLQAATQAAKFTVYGALSSDFADEVAVSSETTVNAAATGSYSVTPPPFAFYRLKVKNSSAGQNTTATVRGIAK